MDTHTLFWLSLAGCWVLAFIGIIVAVYRARIESLKQEVAYYHSMNGRLKLQIDSLRRDIKTLESDLSCEGTKRIETARQLERAAKEVKELSAKVQVRGEDGRFINKN